MSYFVNQSEHPEQCGSSLVWGLVWKLMGANLATHLCVSCIAFCAKATITATGKDHEVGESGGGGKCAPEHQHPTFLLSFERL